MKSPYATTCHKTPEPPPLTEEDHEMQLKGQEWTFMLKLDMLYKVNNLAHEGH